MGSYSCLQLPAGQSIGKKETDSFRGVQWQDERKSAQAPKKEILV